MTHHRLPVRCAQLPKYGAGASRASRGMTLFEVLLALTIFVGSMVALGQLLSTGIRGALRAKLETEAIFRAESKMSELTAGIIPLENVSGQPEEDGTKWTWSVSVEPGPNDQLFVATVTASFPGATRESEISFSLSRFVRDPQVLLDAAAAEAEAAEPE